MSFTTPPLAWIALMHALGLVAVESQTPVCAQDVPATPDVASPRAPINVQERLLRIVLGGYTRRTAARIVIRARHSRTMSFPNDGRRARTLEVHLGLRRVV